MQSKSKASRKPKTTKVQKVVLEQTVKPRSKRSPRVRRQGPRAFQQPNPTSARRSNTGIKTKRGGDVAVVPGEDLVATIASDSKGYSAGDVLVDLIINPAVLNVTRLTALSKLYKKYRIASMSFTYEPTATIEPGSLLGYVDYDALDDPSIGTGLERLQRARASFGEKGVNITNKGTWSLVPMKEPLYIESDSVTGIDHWHRYARFVVYANSAIAASKACGSIVMRYTVEFSHPSYSTPVASSALVPIGYAWRSQWSPNDSKIVETKVWEVSDLKMGITDISSTFPKWNLVFPYGETEDLNQYQIVAYTETYIESAVWSVSDASGGTVLGHVTGRGGSPGNYSMLMAMIEVTSAQNSFHLNFTPISSGGGENLIVQIARIPIWVYSKLKLKTALTDSREEKKSDKIEPFVLVPSSSSSISSASSGSYLSATAPTPANSPSMKTGWFRS